MTHMFVQTISHLSTYLTQKQNAKKKNDRSIPSYQILIFTGLLRFGN